MAAIAPGVAAAPAVPDFASIALAASSEPMVLAATLNGEPKPEPLYVLRNAEGRLLIDEATLTRWRVVYPRDRRVLDDGRAYVPVDSIPGMRMEIVPAKQTASVTLPGDSFLKETVPFEAQAQTAPLTSGWGGFFNYNLFAQHGGATTTGSGLFEPGIFGPYGVGTVLVGANSATTFGTTQRAVRFDANWRYDDPLRMTTLIAGDAISRWSSWGQAVRFGGLQYGTNFSLQPQFLPFPLQAVSGVATVPSTVDIFINNARVGEQQVQPGPFSITNIPIVSGAGNVQLVVKDAFGREQVISQPFYSSQALLRQGLADFGVEAGALRRNFGILSNDYGGWVGSAMYRYGFTDRLTGEARAEGASGLAAAGVHVDFQVADFGIVSAGAVGSHSNAGGGAKVLAGIQRQTSPWAFAINAEWNTSGFRQVATIDQPLQLIRQGAASTSIDFGTWGSFGVAVADQQYRGSRAVDIGTATYSVSLGRFAFLNLSVTRTIAITNQTGVSATLTIPIGNDSFATLAAQRTRGPAGESGFESASFQKNLPAGEGYGYRVYAESDRRYQATASLNGPVGSYSIGVAQAAGATAVQANVSGGLGLIGGYPFASRQLLGSFGLARVDNIEGVTVLSQNQVVGHTDRNGYAVIPELSPYDQNQISVDPLSVPLNATIDSTRMVVVPFLRSGVLVDFPIRRSYGGTMTIVLDDGRPAPEGATVMLAGEGTPFPVAFGGEAYVVGLQEGTNRIRLNWRGATCEFQVRTSVSNDPVPDLGSHVCRGVTR